MATGIQGKRIISFNESEQRCQKRLDRARMFSNSTEAKAGRASFSYPRISSRIIISVLRNGQTGGVSKTVPPLPWFLN